MSTFDEVDFSGHQKEVTEFVDWFANLCSAVGGDEEVRKVQQELKFKQFQGANMVEAVADAYEAFKSRHRSLYEQGQL